MQVSHAAPRTRTVAAEIPADIALVCESVRAVEPLSRLAQRRMPKAKGAVTKVKGMIMIVGVGVRV